ncbi:MAG: hypothetical protein WC919_02700 [Candidatus Paceibacterota bacterium]|jgi:hypothetical protein
MLQFIKNASEYLSFYQLRDLAHVCQVMYTVAREHKIARERTCDKPINTVIDDVIERSSLTLLKTMRPDKLGPSLKVRNIGTSCGYLRVVVNDGNDRASIMSKRIILCACQYDDVEMMKYVGSIVNMMGIATRDITRICDDVIKYSLPHTKYKPNYPEYHRGNIMQTARVLMSLMGVAGYCDHPILDDIYGCARDMMKLLPRTQYGIFCHLVKLCPPYNARLHAQLKPLCIKLDRDRYDVGLITYECDHMLSQ